VTELQSLYGELSIVLVLMFGTYLSWLFVLIGGQVAYAFQNRRTLARHKSWEALSHRARRTLAFLCVAETLRRYRAGRTGPSAEDIGVTARVPASVAEGCLEMLRESGLLALESRTGGHKPARPLEAMSIGQFWNIVDEHATGRAGDLDLSADPAAREHTEVEERLRQLAGGGVTLGELAARG
jgi:membrane protein